MKQNLPKNDSYARDRIRHARMLKLQQWLYQIWPPRLGVVTDE